MGRADQGPAALAAALRGYEQFVVDLAQNEQPDRIAALLVFASSAETIYDSASRCRGARHLHGKWGWTLSARDFYRAFGPSYDGQVISGIGTPDFPVALHICGDATRILPEMWTAPQILELDYKTDKEVAKAHWRCKATFLGAGHPELIWSAGSASEVEDAARQARRCSLPAVSHPGTRFAHWAILRPPITSMHSLRPPGIRCLQCQMGRWKTWHRGA